MCVMESNEGPSGMFEVSALPQSLTIVFSSLLENVDAASRETEAFLERIGLTRKNFRILLAMREALTNAIRHGNHGDPGKVIRYEVRLDRDELVMAVEDEGSGFNWRRLPRSRHRTSAEGGRGIPIMRKYASDVLFNEGGNRLVLRFKS